jgi:hypothetical protein
VESRGKALALPGFPCCSRFKREHGPCQVAREILAGIKISRIGCILNRLAATISFRILSICALSRGATELTSIRFAPGGDPEESA